MALETSHCVKHIPSLISDICEKHVDLQTDDGSLHHRFQLHANKCKYLQVLNHIFQHQAPCVRKLSASIQK